MDRLSNYDALCEMWRQRFLTWDHAAQMENLRLPGLFDDRVELTYFGIPYRIDRKTGRIENVKTPGAVVTFNEQMALYHLLWYAKPSPANSGVWVPFRQVRGAAPFDAAFQKLVLRAFADSFAGKLPQLLAAGEALGFPRLNQSDAGFYVEAFSCMPLQFLFWDSDDEFPAQANILFDQNITDFTHEETVVTIAQDGVRAFLTAAGIPTAQRRYEG